MIYTALTKKALQICFDAHKDQTDKARIPYVTHPLHLAEQMPDETTTVVALLHDVVEDSDRYELDDIIAAGFPKVVTDALALLTHDESVPYMDYVAALKGNPIARLVKLADLEHNSDYSRIDEVTPREVERIKKYQKAKELLLGDIGPEDTDPGEENEEGIRIGTSCPEYNGVILVGMRAGQIVPQMMWFDNPGEYYAAVIHDGSPVPEGYKAVARYEGFVDSITVDGHYAEFIGKEIVFYRKGEDGCMVTVKHEKV